MNSPRSSFFTVDEARQRLCPFIRLSDGVNGNCCTHSCMAWREVVAQRTSGSESELVGYCAVMGTPPEISHGMFASMQEQAARAMGLIKNDS